MSAMLQAHAAYSDVAVATKTDRSLEFDIIAGVTAKLRAAAMGDVPFAQLVSAVDNNRRMWAVIAASMADSQNSYPDMLKARFFYLYEFTSEHSRKVLKNEASLEPLIDINSSVLRGLRTEGGI